MKSVTTKRRSSKNTATRTLGLVRGKKPQKRAPKPKKATEPTIDEARAVLQKAEEAHRDGVFANERRKYAEYLGAVKVVFSKDRGVSKTLTDALTGWWGGPEHLFESGYLQLSRELNVALDALGKIEPVGDWQKDRMFDVTCTLRGIQRRLAAMPCVAKMFADAAEEGAP
jgi:hypothetical protein